MKESRTVEFKQDMTNTFLKTVSAYANYGEGIICFGITDYGICCGMEDPEQACLDIENKINDSISPRPDYALSINRRTNVVTLTVSEGRNKPYLYKGKAYRRNDTATIEVDGVELKRLTLEGCNMYFEQLAANESELSFHILEDKLIAKLGISGLNDDIIKTFGFYTGDHKYNNVAALFADSNRFPGIDVARFGRSISEIMDRETICGVSVIEQFESVMTIFRRYYQYEKIDGAERVGVEMIPEAAFREAIANALVHRTWDVLAHTKVEMYSDRIEVVSPGGLPNGMTSEEYIRGNVSVLRNPAMGNLFFRMHYIEMFGTGVRRIMDAYADCAKKPQFEIYENSIRVILPVVTGVSAISTDGQKVKEALGTGMQLSSSEIATKLGWSRDKAIRTINKLRETGDVQVIGNGRGTKYYN